MAKQLYRPRIADTTLGEKLEGIYFHFRYLGMWK